MRALVNELDERGRPGEAERAALAGGFGRLLRELRTRQRLTMHALAARAACSAGMVAMLETGQRRPRASMLGALAYGLVPDEPGPVLEALRAAAGESVREDTDRSRRARRRRMVRGVQAGVVVLPAAVQGRVDAHAAADEAYAAALRLLAGPGARADVQVLREARGLLAEARRLRELAGLPVLVDAGGKRFGYGWAFP